MKHTERINRINAAINAHFPSNNDAWWVNNEGCSSPAFVTLHRGRGGDKIDPKWVAAFILKTEKSVQYVHYASMCICYTRNTLRRGGMKI